MTAVRWVHVCGPWLQAHCKAGFRGLGAASASSCPRYSASKETCLVCDLIYKLPSVNLLLQQVMACSGPMNDAAPAHLLKAQPH